MTIKFTVSFLRVLCMPVIKNQTMQNLQKLLKITSKQLLRNYHHYHYINILLIF